MWLQCLKPFNLKKSTGMTTVYPGDYFEGTPEQGERVINPGFARVAPPMDEIGGVIIDWISFTLDLWALTPQKEGILKIIQRIELSWDERNEKVFFQAIAEIKPLLKEALPDYNAILIFARARKDLDAKVGQGAA